MRTLRRVLVVHPYGIGDLLFLTPVLRALRLVPTVEKVDLLLGSRTESVVKDNPHVDEIFSVDKDRIHARGFWASLRELAGLGLRLRSNRYDLMLDYSLRQEYGFWGRGFLGIPRCAGLDYRGRGFFHNLRLAIPQGFEGRHVVETYCALAERAGVRVEDRFPEFYLTAAARQEAGRLFEDERIRSAVVVAPGGGESWGKDAGFKRWPVPFFAELLGRLRTLVPFDKAIIVGTERERDLAAELAGLATVPCVDLTGCTSLEVTVAVIEKSCYFVGNDGGLLHLAHAVGTPLAGLYGPVDPVVYGPYPASSRAVTVVKTDLACRPCYRRFRYKADCQGRECLRALTPDLVLDAIRQQKNFKNNRIEN
ncbi:MAG: glycosyltransferase family 9 protein [Candidatus Omnitrophota bacterium]|jgi:lipopolysaccharide heptosyltransferase II